MSWILLAALLWPDAAPVLAQSFKPSQTAVPGSVPRRISYQGRLEEGGSAVSGAKVMSFRLFESPTGGAPVFEQLNQSVTLTGGVFAVGLDIGLEALLGDTTKYLEIEVDSTVLAPRDPLRSVPYARVAEAVEGEIEISSGGFVISNQSGPILYVSSAAGSVGIGTTLPASGAKLHVAGGDLVIGSPASFAAATGVEDLFVEGNIVVDGAVSFQGAVFADLGVGVTPSPGELFKVGAGTFTALQSGLVGVGTSVPAVSLEIQAGTSPGLVLDHAAQPQLELRRAGTAVLRAGHDGSVGRFGTQSPTPLRLQANGADALSITSGGDVGVGLTNPSVRLDVAGDMNVSGALTLGTALAVTQGGTGATTAADARTNLGALATNGSNVAAGFPEFAITISSTAAQASRLETDPPNCTVAGEFPKGIDETGAAQNCTNVGSESEGVVEGLVYDGDNAVQGSSWAVTAAAGRHINFDSNTFFIDVDNNRVGLGLTNPSHRLQVAGDVNLSAGSIYRENGSGTLSNSISGNAATATALAANGANCLAGNAPLGVNASGAAESCFDVATQGELDAHTGETDAHSATAANTVSRIVLRDPDGSFAVAFITGTVRSADLLSGATTDCPAGQYARGIDADGEAAGCTAPETDIYNGDNAVQGSSWAVVAAAGRHINFDSDTFFIDVDNDRVGLGTTSPSAALDVSGSGGGVLASSMTLTGVGGNVPHACNLPTPVTQNLAAVSVDCAADEIAVGGGGECGGGTTLLTSRPLDADTWEIVCSAADAGNTAHAVCCAQ